MVADILKDDISHSIFLNWKSSRPSGNSETNKKIIGIIKPCLGPTLHYGGSFAFKNIVLPNNYLNKMKTVENQI